MTWARLDDRANEHRKQLLAGAEACWLWACGLMYANRQAARDGFIPEQMLPMLYPLPPRQRGRLVAKLVEVKLWHEVPGGYQIHEFRAWNRTREQLEEEREATRLRVAEHRRKKRLEGDGNAVTALQVTRDGNESVPDPLHSTPLPVQERSESERRGREPDAESGTHAVARPAAFAAVAAATKKAPRRWTRVPPDWQHKPDHVNLALQLGAPLDAELAKFRDHEFRSAKSDPDACFRTWLRRSIELRREAIGTRLSEGRAGDGLGRQLARVQALEAAERAAGAARPLGLPGRKAGPL